MNNAMDECLFSVSMNEHFYHLRWFITVDDVNFMVMVVLGG